MTELQVQYNNQTFYYWVDEKLLIAIYNVHG